MIVYPNKNNFLIAVLFILFANSFSAFAQNSDSKKLDLNFKDEQYIKILSDIGKLYGVKFYYKPQDLASYQGSLNLHSVTIDSALSSLFKSKPISIAKHLSSFVLTRDVKIKPFNISDQYVRSNDDKIVLAAGGVVAKESGKMYQIGVQSNAVKTGFVTVSGLVLDGLSKRPIKGATISTNLKDNIAKTDEEGFYTVKLAYGLNNLLIKSSLLKEFSRKVMVYGDGRLDVEIVENSETLKEVNIVSQKAFTLKNLEMGVNRLSAKAIKQVPTVFGEADVLRVVLTLPGVQSVGEASTGFNVRGGSVDQNLVMLDNSTIYNPSHFFGFFSAFNPEIVKDIQLYKSTIPERFGGRLASVLEVTNRQGSKSKFGGSAGIGMITSRLNIEGPIDSGKTSFILGGRATYSNWLLKLLPDEYKNSKASFYDINLGVNHLLKNGGEINVMFYNSKDNFRLSSDTTYRYDNRNASIEWKNIFSNRFKGSFSLSNDAYNYSVSSEQNPINAYQLKFNINQTNFRSYFTYDYNGKNILNFGLSSTLYKLKPGEFTPNGTRSGVVPDILEPEKALESAIFIGDEYKLNDKLSFNLGLRYSVYNYLGPKQVSYYVSDNPKSESTVNEVKNYKGGEFIKTYHYPEVRLATRYAVTNDFSVKASYNTLQQYIHLLSNTTTIAPTDIWKLSDPNIRPQRGSQVSLGLYKNFNAQTIETSIEGYYKKLTDYLDYKSGANLVLNHNIEQDVVSTQGRAYGLEVFIKKNTGKLNGWVSYTYSRILLKMDNPNEGPLINEGNEYPANYDKPHAFNFTGNYKFKQRYHFSLNFTYSTGRPITLPIAKYHYAGSERVYYSDRNAYRIPDYLRVDASFNIEGNHKIKQFTHSYWTIGVYNVTGRRNIFSTFFTQEGGAVNGYNLSIFASAIPFINYNIKF